VTGTLSFCRHLPKSLRLVTVFYMTADELAKKLGCSRATIFNLKKAYPDKAPKSFGNLQSWTVFVMRHATDPDMYLRVLNR
jgi:hypothetical protein